MALYDWQKEMALDKTGNHATPDLLFTAEELARAKDRADMAREIEILNKVDHFHFWADLMKTLWNKDLRGTDAL